MSGPSQSSDIPQDAIFSGGLTLGPEFFYLSSDGQFVLLAIEPVTEMVDSRKLATVLQHSPYANYQVSEKALQDAAKSFNELKTRTKEEIAVSHSVVIVARRLDGQVSIEVNKDGMTAQAKVTAPYAGKQVDEAQMLAALAQAGVVQGIDNEAINELVCTIRRAPSGAEQSSVVANGLLPVNGTDSHFERLVETLKERVLRPQILDSSQDLVDLRDFGAITAVAPGVAMMRRHPPEPGIPGYLVTGVVLPAKDGNILPFNIGKGAEVSSYDPDLLVATQDGLPKEIEHGMQVDDVLTIKDVDAKFGHVDFNGSVVISGNVCEGMRVRATGCVTVAGLVESAYIEAGGDILIDKGLIGHQITEHGHDRYSCSVHCAGAVSVRFAQYAEISAAGDIMVASHALHCRIVTHGALVVADASRNKGSLIGGIIHVGTQVIAVSVGGVADSSTQICVLGRYAELLARRKELRSKIETSTDAVKKIDEAEAKVRQMPIGEKRNLIASKITATRTHLEAQLAAEQQEWNDINAEREDFLQRARVVCCKNLYGGVKIEIADYKLATNKDYGASEVKYSDGQLLPGPLLSTPDIFGKPKKS